MKREQRPRLILISGYTAAGKTTHARLLATHLGWDYLGSSTSRREILYPGEPTDGREWTPAHDRKRSASLCSDRALDKLMSQQIAASQNPLVVDSWLQPWLCEQPSALRVWLHSDRASRIRKAAVSCLRNGLTPPSELGDELDSKDHFSATIFRQLYGIEFGFDPEIFDIMADNSEFIRQATVASSDDGIADFEPILEKLIECQLSVRGDSWNMR